MLRVAQTDPRNVEIRSDSQYVVSRFAVILQMAEAWQGSNADLWFALAEIVRQDPGRIMVTKVKGHATWGDVDSGEVNFLDKRGNACADTLARQGADQHAMLPFILQRAHERKKQTKAIQGAMVDILTERGADLDAIREVLPPATRGGFVRRVRRRM